MQMNKRFQIAESLLNDNIITKEQLDTALETHHKTGKKIGQTLVDLGYISQEKLFEILSTQLNIPYIDLRNYHLSPEIVKILPEFYARHFRAIVLKKSEDNYLVGMVDPQDLIATDEIELLLKSKIDLALINEDDLLYVLDNIYRRSEEISRFAETLSEELEPTEVVVLSDTQDLSSEDVPVVNLLRSIFEDASQINASDIHIEPGDQLLRIRLRVDGVLQEQIVHEKSIASALVQRVKLVAGLNIAEKRLPQDGRFSINVKNKLYDVRVSTLPVQFGESLVMRLLSQSDNVLELKEIGMPKAILDYYTQILTASYGLLLIVGPTGSGKTTTLYASLNMLNSPEDKIITVEDPVEYRLPRINQVQVNTQIGLTFATILRSILRQDPDIIMIGELRDHDTVEIALRSAMTGHFVLSTLHTNDTISSATRLLDMGAEGYLIASVLRAILAMRLVRRLCEHCATITPLTSGEINWLQSLHIPNIDFNSFKEGSGCNYCHNTGYQGRIGVFELLAITPELADALRREDTAVFHRFATQQPLYKPLVHSALDLAIRGITTVKEVIRMAGEV